MPGARHSLSVAPDTCSVQLYCMNVWCQTLSAPWGTLLPSKMNRLSPATCQNVVHLSPSPKWPNQRVKSFHSPPPWPNERWDPSWSQTLTDLTVHLVYPRKRFFYKPWFPWWKCCCCCLMWINRKKIWREWCCCLIWISMTHLAQLYCMNALCQILTWCNFTAWVPGTRHSLGTTLLWCGNAWFKMKINVLKKKMFKTKTMNCSSGLSQSIHP